MIEAAILANDDDHVFDWRSGGDFLNCTIGIGLCLVNVPKLNAANIDAQKMAFDCHFRVSLRCILPPKLNSI